MKKIVINEFNPGGISIKIFRDVNSDYPLLGLMNVGELT